MINFTVSYSGANTKVCRHLSRGHLTTLTLERSIMFPITHPTYGKSESVNKMHVQVQPGTTRAVGQECIELY